MRGLTLALTLAAGLSGAVVPAAAQDDLALSLHRQAELQMQADLARQREIALVNQLAALDAQVQTQAALRDLEALRYRPVIQQITPRATPGPALEAAALPSIPDSALAASNARVRAASENRR